MYCSGCGREVVTNAKFCPQCGRPLNVASVANPTGSPLPGVVRPLEGRKVAGVCIGLSQRYGWDVATVRVITLLAGILIFPLGVIAYCVLWIILPEQPLLLPAVATVTSPQTPAGSQQT
jgi:phage shock protein C